MEITVDEFLRLNNPQIIDIRMPQKFNDNHIPGAINVSANSLLSAPEKYLNPSLTYYVYCQKGITSKTLAQLLWVKGYKVYNIVDGYEGWIMKI